MKMSLDFFKKHTSFCLSCPAFFAALILRMIAVFRDYLPNGYFENAAHGISAVLILFSTVVLFVPSFTEKNRNSEELSVLLPDDRTPLFSGILCAGAFVYVLSFLFSSHGNGIETYPALRLFIGVLVLAFIALTVISLFRGRESLFAPAALIGAIGFCLYPVYLYIEQSMPLNADEKIVEEFAYLSVSAFLLCLARTDIGRMPFRFFPACSLAMAYFALYVSVPAILFSSVRSSVLTECSGTPYWFFAVAVYALFTLLRTGRETAEKTAPNEDSEIVKEEDEA